MKKVWKSFFGKELLVAKLAYFFWNGKSVFISYLPVFLEDIGFSPSRVTLIFSLYIISQFSGSIIWAFVTDRSNKYSIIVIGLTIFAIIFTLPQPFIASLFTSSTQNATLSSIHKIKLPNETRITYFFVVMNILGPFFEGGLHGQVDNFIVDYIVEQSSIKAYGIQRLFGAIGNAFFAILIGIIIDRKLFSSISIYTPIFASHAMLMTLFLASFYKIVSWSERKKYFIQKLQRQQETVKHDYPNFFSVLKGFDVYPFYIFVFVNGLAYGANMGIGMIHLLNLNASPTLMGINLLLMQVSSVIIYPLSSKIIRLCGGPLSITAFSSIVYSVRFSLLGYINNPWAILPLQLTQGVNGALFWVATIEYTYAKSNLLIGNLMFGSLNAIYKGASRSLGIFIAGCLYEKYGGESCYLYLGAVLSIFSLLNIFYVAYIKLSSSYIEKTVDRCMKNQLTDEHIIPRQQTELFDWDDAFFSGLLIVKRLRQNRDFVANLIRRLSTQTSAPRASISQEGNESNGSETFRSLLS